MEQLFHGVGDFHHIENGIESSWEEIQIQFDDANKSNEVKADQSNFVWY